MDKQNESVALSGAVMQQIMRMEEYLYESKK